MPNSKGLGTHPKDISVVGDSLGRLACAPSFLAPVSPVLEMSFLTGRR